MAESSDAKVIYVSPEGDDAWCGAAPEPGVDGQGPVATVAHARDLARGMEKRADSPATIVLRGGRYRLAKPLVLRPADSHITFRAAEGETPVLDGGAPVTGWREDTVEGRTVWTADASELIEKVGCFRQLFVGGRRARRARLPGDGFFWMEDVPGTTLEGAGRKTGQRHTFRSAEGDFPATRNLTDCDVVVIHWWHEERRPVASFDPVTRHVTLAEETVRPLVDDMSARFAKYYVENVFEGLAEPGDWYLDRSERRLYYVPLPGETPAETEAFAAGLTELVRLAARPEQGQAVTGVRFEGLTFEHADWRGFDRSRQAAAYVPAAITFVGARDCALEDCTVRHVGTWAVDLLDGCRDCFIVGCTIEDIGAGAIKVSGADVWGPRRCRTGENTLTDNHLHALGRVYHGATGIALKHTFGNLVAHNHIHDLYYSGINCGWVWGYWESVSRDNRIEKNHIHDIGRGLLNDMGGIYLLGVQPGTALRGNLIHGVRASKYGGWAIYLDEGSSHIVVENNVCYDATSQAFHLHFGRESVLRNNIWAFAGEGLVAISRGNECDWPAKGCVPDGRVTNAFTFERNIVITDGAPVFLGGMDDPTGRLDARTFTSDLNLFWDVGGKPVRAADGGHLVATEGYERSYDWDAWQGLGYDRHSIVADPKCADVENRDFTLGPDSPAPALGFQPIDLSDVGPRPKAKRVSVRTPVRQDPERKP